MHVLPQLRLACLTILLLLIVQVGQTNAQRGSEDLVISREFLNDGRITNDQCGQFIEYLCTLVPGMWAEKLADGGFEGLTPYKVAFIPQTDFREHPWYPSGEVNRAQYVLDPDHPVSGKTAQRIDVPPGAPCTVGISQDGISIRKGQEYELSVYLRQAGIARPVEIRLHHESAAYASCAFAAEGQWKKFHTVLTYSRRIR